MNHSIKWKRVNKKLSAFIYTKKVRHRHDALVWLVALQAQMLFNFMNLATCLSCNLLLNRF